jgi:hypothetical protein
MTQYPFVDKLKGIVEMERTDKAISGINAIDDA